MIWISTVILWLGITAPAQDAPEMPAAWQQKLDAAFKAWESSQTAEAEALFKQVVSEAEKLGPGDLRQAKPLELLAEFYICNNRRERVREAEALLLKALTIREKLQGTESLDVGLTLASLGACRILTKGKPDPAAMTTLQRALTIFETSKGKDDPEVARVLTLLFAAQWQRRDFEAAESALARAVAIREKSLGPESPKLADSLDDLGDLHAMQAFDRANDTSAVMRLKETLRVESRSILEGFDAAFDATDATDRANEAIAEREGKLAESFYKRALEIREKVLKPDDPEIAETVCSLGQLAVGLHRTKECVPYFERWLALQEKANMPASEQQGSVLWWLSCTALERKEFNEAERLLARTQGLFEKIRGPDADVILGILSMRFEAALETRRFDDAERFIKRNIELQCNQLGAQDPLVAEVRSLMARSYKDHARDRRAPALWLRLDAIGRWRADLESHRSLAESVALYAKLLRRTNVVLPQPTEEDLSYLKKLEAIYPWVDNYDGLVTTNVLQGFPSDDDALSYVARLYDLELLYADRGPTDTRWITDVGLSSIKDLINLRRLSLEGARITDAGPSHLVELKDLEYLRLSDAPIGDKGLPYLRGLTKLRELRLDGTNVTDGGLDQLKAMDSLVFLDLRRTRVTRAGFERLKLARPDISIKYDSRKPGIPGNAARE